VTDSQQQQEIRTALEVVDPSVFDPAAEAERRITFLVRYLRESGLRGYVLGISGGGDARFVAVRLPYHVQKDEADARRALDFIRADEVLTVDIGPGVDAQWEQLVAAGLEVDDAVDDYHKGNVKARHRMVAQFAIAGVRGMAVVGTDQAAEAVVGFFTKFGDGAADLTPLFGLPKRRVREIGRHLDVPQALVDKVPTADLESDKPLVADEVALGVRYEAVDDYLEGLPVAEEDEATILRWYRRTAHKRALPVTPDGYLQDR
jgi:NAD+ synthase